MSRKATSWLWNLNLSTRTHTHMTIISFVNVFFLMCQTNTIPSQTFFFELNEMNLKKREKQSLNQISIKTRWSFLFCFFFASCYFADDFIFKKPLHHCTLCAFARVFMCVRLTNSAWPAFNNTRTKRTYNNKIHTLFVL